MFTVYLVDSAKVGFRHSTRFISYVLAEALCSRCLETVSDLSHLKRCSRPSKSSRSWRSATGRCCYLPAAKTSEFKKLVQRENVRSRQFYRELHLRAVPLPFEQLLDELRAQQNDRCYYCFNEFEVTSSDRKPHLDHFISVANGGTNSIFNLVYACGRCNQKKFSKNGEQFIKELSFRGIPATERRIVMEELLKDHRRAEPDPGSPEHTVWSYELIRRTQRIERETKKPPIVLLNPRKISKMRKAVCEWKNQFAPEHLHPVEQLVQTHFESIPARNSVEYAEWEAATFKLLLRLEQIRHESKAI